MIDATNAMRHNFRLVTRINPRVAAEGHCLQHACAGNCLISQNKTKNEQHTLSIPMGEPPGWWVGEGSWADSAMNHGGGRSSIIVRSWGS